MPYPYCTRLGNLARANPSELTVFPSTGLQYQETDSRIEIRFALLVDYLQIIEDVTLPVGQYAWAL